MRFSDAPGVKARSHDSSVGPYSPFIGGPNFDEKKFKKVKKLWKKVSSLRRKICTLSRGGGYGIPSNEFWPPPPPFICVPLSPRLAAELGPQPIGLTWPTESKQGGGVTKRLRGEALPLEKGKSDSGRRVDNPKHLLCVQISSTKMLHCAKWWAGGAEPQQLHMSITSLENAAFNSRLYLLWRS